MKKRLLISGGGTAGHVWPLISLYENIKDEYDVLFVGSGNERELVEKAGIKYKKILSGKWRRYFSWLNFIDPIKVLFGFIQAKYLMITFRPQVVFTKGGYVTVPVGIAAALFRRRLIIHESDAVMGLSNRILSRFAKKILTAYPKENYPKKYQRKIVWTGVPVRAEIFTGDYNKAIDDFDFSKELPTVLFIGGSSGAAGINKLVLESLEELLSFCQIIHITGKKNYHKVREAATLLDTVKRSRFRYFDFVTRELPDIFAVSDLAVSRSGATTLTELAALGRPTIFIPYPFSASDHQRINAQILERNQAAVVYDEKELTSVKLVDQIKRLLDNKRALKDLSENIKKFYKSNAVELIIAEIKEG